MSRPVSPELRDGVRKIISDTFYECRNAGESMEVAITKSTNRILVLIESVDENAHARGVLEGQEL